MPRKELKFPHQVTQWLDEWGEQLAEPGAMILIGSAGLLWHAAQLGKDQPLPENSMDADPVTSSDAVAELAYDALIGSEFEQRHGWHVNLMPDMVLKQLPEGWETRVFTSIHGRLTVTIPAPEDLLAPKRQRNEPRDQQHEAYARALGMI